MSDLGKSNPIKGRSVSNTEIAQLNELKALFKPEVGMKRVEDFAKWLFGGTTIIATLGAGLSNVVFGQLVGYGKLVFSLAILFFGLSLACAAVCLAPKWVDVNLNSRDLMQLGVIEKFKYQRGFLIIATVSFSFALLLAALAPFVSSLSDWPKPSPVRVSITYSMEAQGKFEAQLSGAGLMPYGSVEIELKTDPPVTKMIMPRRRDVADGKGKATLQLVLPQVNKIKGSLLVISKWQEASEKMRVDTLRIPLTQVHD